MAAVAAAGGLLMLASSFLPWIGTGTEDGHRCAIRPPHGELHETGWQSANLQVSGNAGVLAGEEMCRWLVNRLAERAAVEPPQVIR